MSNTVVYGVKVELEDFSTPSFPEATTFRGVTVQLEDFTIALASDRPTEVRGVSAVFEVPMEPPIILY